MHTISRFLSERKLLLPTATILMYSWHGMIIFQTLHGNDILGGKECVTSSVEQTTNSNALQEEYKISIDRKGPMSVYVYFCFRIYFKTSRYCYQNKNKYMNK